MWENTDFMCRQVGFFLFFLNKNDSGLFKGPRICKLKTQQGTTQNVPEEKEKLSVLTVKSTCLKKVSPAFLARRLAQDRMFRMSSGLDRRCQVV